MGAGAGERGGAGAGERGGARAWWRVGGWTWGRAKRAPRRWRPLSITRGASEASAERTS